MFEVLIWTFISWNGFTNSRIILRLNESIVTWTRYHSTEELEIDAWLKMKLLIKPDLFSKRNVVYAKSSVHRKWQESIYMFVWMPDSIFSTHQVEFQDIFYLKKSNKQKIPTVSNVISSIETVAGSSTFCIFIGKGVHLGLRRLLYWYISNSRNI